MTIEEGVKEEQSSSVSPAEETALNEEASKSDKWENQPDVASRDDETSEKKKEADQKPESDTGDQQVKGLEKEFLRKKLVSTV